VSVVDNTPPTITNCPADVEIACGASTDPANTGTATATDDCGATVTYNDRTVENCSRKAITRTWTATDPCGNKSTCVQLITVTDKVAPVITCPPNKTGANALTCGASILPANTGTATATDACSNTSVIVYYKDVPQGNNNTSCVNFTRTWYAVDASGNTNSCNQLIELIVPTSSPVTKAVSEATKQTNNTKNSSSQIIEKIGGSLQIQAFPNPFSNKVTFRFSSPTTGRAILEVFNIMGQKLAVVYEGMIKGGVVQNIQYDAGKTNKATLIYKLRVDDKTANGKLIQLK
jgi:hypothetical protein